MNIYNFTRWEYCAIRDHDSQDWTYINRVRSRFGAEVPLASGDNAWKPETWYVFADIEPIYRFDRNYVDPFRFRLGPAYILNDRVRMEFQWYVQLTRKNEDSPLKYTDNIFRLNIKIGMNEEIIVRLSNPDAADD